jgi:hypothetical protein
MAAVRITDDPDSFVQECVEKFDENIRKVIDEQKLEYARISAEYASKLDPESKELYMLKLRLMRAAHERDQIISQ